MQVKADLHAANEEITELRGAVDREQQNVDKVKKANLDLRIKEQYQTEELEGLRRWVTGEDAAEVCGTF